MNGNETPPTGNPENSPFAGSSPAMRTIFPQQFRAPFAWEPTVDISQCIKTTWKNIKLNSPRNGLNYLERGCERKLEDARLIPLLVCNCTILRCGSVYLFQQPAMRNQAPHTFGGLINGF